MRKDNESSLPVFIESFDIKNYKGIVDTEIGGITNENRWIFLTGENGYGKTSVLQAIAECLFAPLIKDTLGSNNNDRIINLIKPYSDNRSFIKLQHYISDVNSNQKKFKYSYLTCYGSSRLNIRPRSNEVEDEDSPIASLFDSRVVLRNIELELSRWYFKQDDVEFKEKFENVVEALKKLIPNLKEINVDKKTDKVTYVEKDEEGNLYAPVNFSQLASGFKSLIALAGDMMLRLFESQPEVTDPTELAGIVIIDEIDLHFHPNIQRHLPSLLSDIFPKIQFIVSTHSPIPILGAPANSVFLKVNRTKELGITIQKIDHLEIANLTPNTILTSPIFGFSDILAENHNPKLRVRTEVSYQEMMLNDEVEKRLKAFADSGKDKFDGLFGKEYKPE